MSASAETHFGFSTVPLTEKQTLVDEIGRAHV